MGCASTTIETPEGYRYHSTGDQQFEGLLIVRTVFDEEGNVIGETHVEVGSASGMKSSVNEGTWAAIGSLTDTITKLAPGP